MIRLTNEQAIEMMKAKLECMTRDVSGSDEVCNNKKCDNCYLNYAQGNMGEQKEWLRMGIKALENQKNLIEELKKIKDKINSEDVDCQYEDDYVYSSGLQKAIMLIDNRIEALKGN